MDFKILQLYETYGSWAKTPINQTSPFKHLQVFIKRTCVCVCAYLLEHHGLLLLEQGLELLGGEDLLLEDLLHLLRCDHLGTHHGHRHWNLEGEARVCDEKWKRERERERKKAEG